MTDVNLETYDYVKASEFFPEVQENCNKFDFWFYFPLFSLIENIFHKT